MLYTEEEKIYYTLKARQHTKSKLCQFLTGMISIQCNLVQHPHLYNLAEFGYHGVLQLRDMQVNE